MPGYVDTQRLLAISQPADQEDIKSVKRKLGKLLSS